MLKVHRGGLWLLILVMSVFLFLGIVTSAWAADNPMGSEKGAVALCIAGAALAVGMAGVGSAIGIGYAGQTSLGAMSEDPANFAKYLLLTALPGTQGIYGFVVAFLIMQWSGVLGGATGAMSLSKGLEFFFSALPVALAGLLSAIHQGKVCAAGVNMTTQRPGEVGKALVMGVFVEFYAVLGLLISILLLISIRG